MNTLPFPIHKGPQFTSSNPTLTQSQGIGSLSGPTDQEVPSTTINHQSAFVTGNDSSHLTINFSLDSSVANAPAGFTAALNQVATYFANTFRDPITLNIAVGYGEIGGHTLGSGVVGESGDTLIGFSYSQIKTALAHDGTSAVDSAAVASLPASDPTGGHQYWITSAQAKSIGLSTSNGGLDGEVAFTANSGTFDFDNSNGVNSGQLDFFGVVAHEVTEVMGRILLDGQNVAGSPGYDIEDLFHFSSPGVHSFSNIQPGYFSADNGTTNLGSFNTNSQGDFGDWASSVGPDSFLAFGQSGTVLPVSANDLSVMDAIGWDLAAAPPSSGSSPPAPPPSSSPPVTSSPVTSPFGIPASIPISPITPSLFTPIASPVSGVPLSIPTSSPVLGPGFTPIVGPVAAPAFSPIHLPFTPSFSLMADHSDQSAAAFAPDAFDFSGTNQKAMMAQTEPLLDTVTSYSIQANENFGPGYSPLGNPIVADYLHDDPFSPQTQAVTHLFSLFHHPWG